MSSPREIRQIVIHITDGGSRITGTIGWFQNPNQRNARGEPIHVSAHYVVGRDGEVVQVLVVGPFGTARPNAAGVLEAWRWLTQRQGHPADQEFSHYLATTLSVLVLQGAERFRRLSLLLVVAAATRCAGGAAAAAAGWGVSGVLAGVLAGAVVTFVVTVAVVPGAVGVPRVAGMARLGRTVGCSEVTAARYLDRLGADRSHDRNWRKPPGGRLRKAFGTARSEEQR